MQRSRKVKLRQYNLIKQPLNRGDLKAVLCLILIHDHDRLHVPGVIKI